MPKQDMLAVPGLDGAMENWGLIMFGEQFLIADEDTTSRSQKETNAVVMAHELAHQWFGNLVTLNWWSDVWLNEGMASYLGYIGAHEVSE